MSNQRIQGFKLSPQQRRLFALQKHDCDQRNQ